MKHYSDFGDLTHWPVVGMHDEYSTGFRDEPHSHSRAQLLYASSGVMSVTVENASFVVPPQRAVWIPSHHVHSVSCRGPVSLRTLYLDEESTGLSDLGCHVVEISDLLRALIVELATIETTRPHTEREKTIIQLMIGELKNMPNAPYGVPMPSDYRLLRICKTIMSNPGDTASLDELASEAGMGRRTFTRLFKQQTGMGVASWRHQVRLMEAISLLSIGKPITSVAFDVGYESASAFTAMFNRSFGVPPSQYMARSAAA
ncbi:helix-turn-helix domain-containing protein [Ponticaulis sp.]|uniref:AraC family transcriptional regulator n=1 Tax=Ponticaulis sp. TaxID=2020902 RepID=UPI000B706F62|nr:helix-turn-helix transcriptional regulator [Ponticaulis sp.]MAI91202.1 AraC family transcriptional regulator [Ponticaulis sp.]OUX98516.1 MAG: AraC family transcriptional regulator [Hyphomonadaceae bacterium TMED5]